jgi:hypothetical protein
LNKREIKKEIKRLSKFIIIASIENPLNLDQEKQKLAELQEELKK